MLRHLERLWSQYTRTEDGELLDLARLFLSRAHMEKMFAEEVALHPGLHCAGNILAHFMTFSNTVIDFDSVDLYSWAYLMGISWTTMLNGVWNVGLVMGHMVKLERAWYKFQRQKLQINTPVPLVQFEKLSKTLETVWDVQQREGSLYSKKTVFVFRVFHGQADKRLLPRLQWGDDNHWIDGLFKYNRCSTSEEVLRIFAEQYCAPIASLLGHTCQSLRNVNYLAYAKHRLFDAIGVIWDRIEDYERFS